jgi:hypothetical protein
LATQWHKKIKIDGFWPLGWFGHPMSKPSKYFLMSFVPWGWFCHPQGKPSNFYLFIFLWVLAFENSSATPNKQNPSFLFYFIFLP